MRQLEHVVHQQPSLLMHAVPEHKRHQWSPPPLAVEMLHWRLRMAYLTMVMQGVTPSKTLAVSIGVRACLLVASLYLKSELLLLFRIKSSCTCV